MKYRLKPKLKQFKTKDKTDFVITLSYLI